MDAGFMLTVYEQKLNAPIPESVFTLPPQPSGIRTFRTDDTNYDFLEFDPWDASDLVATPRGKEFLGKTKP